MLFGKFALQLSEIFCDGIHHFMRCRTHLIISAMPKLFVVDRPEACASVVFHKSDTMQNCIAFIDSTFIGVACPGGEELCSRLCKMGTNASKCSSYRI